MIKRLVLPGYLLLLLFICLCTVVTTANAQDTTKKAEPEKEKKEVIQTATPPVVAEKKPEVTIAAPLKTRSYYHYRRMHPAVIPPAVPVNNDSAAQTNILKAQAAPVQSIDKSLNSQYQYLLTKTFNYQQPLVTALWKNVTDTLNHERTQLKDQQAKLTANNHTIDSLKSAISSKEQISSQSGSKNDSMSMFGLEMPKSTYNLIMFGLIIGLAVALVVVGLTIAKYKHEAKHRTELFEEVDEEYKSFKAKANEKEKKLARELQTERNKLDELLGRG